LQKLKKVQRRATRFEETTLYKVTKKICLLTSKYRQLREEVIRVISNNKGKI